MDRKISTFVATAVGIGAIIGAGIFVLSGTAIALAGANALLAFVIVGIIAIIIALEFGELSTVMPFAKGAAYSYVYKAFGSELAFITGIVQYFSYATSIAAIALGFGSYFISLIPGVGYIGAIPFAIALIIALAVLNLLGIEKATKVDSFLVVIKIAVLLAFISFGLYFAFGAHNFAQSNFSVSQSQMGLGALFAASIAIFFAYSGFQTISTFVSDMKKGPKSAAWAILASVIISMALYIAVIFALLLMAPASSYAITPAPLSFALQASGAPYWLYVLVGIGALIATTSATFAMVLSSSRMIYQISADHLLPKIFRSYDKNKKVAKAGVAVSAFIGIVTLFSGNIYTIAAISNFGLLFSYLMASITLFHFRKHEHDGEFRAPLYPYLSIIAIIAILVFMAGMPSIALYIGIALILALIVIYYSLREIEDKHIVRIKLFR